MENDPAAYVLDTHALYWYLWDPSRLSPAAVAVLQRLEAGRGRGVVPTIVLVELHSLMRKRGSPQSMASLLDILDRAPSLILDPLARQHHQACDDLDSVAEGHARLIGAAALVHHCAVVTRDPALHAAPIDTIW